MNETVLILDFGSQVTQLIARRIRESGIYCEVRPFNRSTDAIRELDPRAIVLSGGPASVASSKGPSVHDQYLIMGSPFLGFAMASRSCVLS